MIPVTVNGTQQKIEVPDDTPLIWVLREELQLKGTKLGCGMGICGACTVHLDGQPIRACVTKLSAVRNRKINTIESLSTPEQLHPVQQAWLKHRVPQCGYCQPGQIMSAVGLLRNNPHPTDEEIKTYMSGNICRCGTYQRIRNAIRDLASKTTAPGEPSPP